MLSFRDFMEGEWEQKRLLGSYRNSPYFNFPIHQRYGWPLLAGKDSLCPICEKPIQHLSFITKWQQDPTAMKSRDQRWVHRACGNQANHQYKKAQQGSDIPPADYKPI